MSQNRPRTNENCQPNGLDRANSANLSAAAKLASLLSIPGLTELNETEAAQLVEVFKRVAHEEFDAGWNLGRRYEQYDYNGHGLRLLGMGPSSSH